MLSQTNFQHEQGEPNEEQGHEVRDKKGTTTTLGTQSWEMPHITEPNFRVICQRLHSVSKMHSVVQIQTIKRTDNDCTCRRHRQRQNCAVDKEIDDVRFCSTRTATPLLATAS